MSLRVRIVKLERLPSSAGISPLKTLSLRVRIVKLERLPSSAGISPLKAFSLRNSHSRLERLPNHAGISPLKALTARFRCVTRPLSLVWTPYHSPMGASLSQLALPSQFSPSVAL